VTPLWSWLRALTTEKRTVREVGSWMCWIGCGLSQWAKSSSKSRPYAGFSFFQGMSRRGRIPSSTSVPLASLVPHSTTSVTEHNFQPSVPSLTRTIHPIPTHHGNHLTFMFHWTHIPPTQPSPFLSLPSLTLLPSSLPRRCSVFVSTPFTHPPFPFYICCNPCCSPSLNLHCT